METVFVEKSHAAAKPLAYTYIDSPVGRLLLAGDERGLWLLSFADGGNPARPGDEWLASQSTFREAGRQLDAYFHRELRSFTLPLHLSGTDFQVAVWKALISIPYGSTTSYGALARSIGRPSAVRAVGGANHANPIAIVVPCHRVVGSNGKLVGYGGGLAVKDKLLALERGELFPR
jgi:methylated-DNA-[protein]-cysteine S-methyltransferase